MFLAVTPCCKFATIVLAVELRCDLFGVGGSFDRAYTILEEQWQKTGPMRGTPMTCSPVIAGGDSQVAPRMNHVRLADGLPLLSARTNDSGWNPSIPVAVARLHTWLPQSRGKETSESLSSHYQHCDSMVRWTHVPDGDGSAACTSFPGSNPRCSLPAMIRQKLKIRPERKSTPAHPPPPLPFGAGTTKRTINNHPTLSRCIISVTSQDSGRRSIPISMLTPSCGGDGGKATNPMARSTLHDLP
ncbi:hypothetical protein BO78DRAFT_437003 [Aspergillus sclerotiicarbonarius CBS 121057]|uniref:Uncharacterized protein n=1 Tax=Aspergillus sclerotiicarbonarius (strain CBS 121057 / IBT 28362) TaxID=1448318 RepID=A0A319EBB5_ASPSB|nr:hypothetical protein BO78DRAFT_437003 [Aspergillus sclerotiicarbonarius CBS 121057]